MTVYRLTKAAYKEDLSGIGAKLYGSRWNSAGKPMLFTAQTISLALLETLVHLDRMEIPPDYRLLHIKIPDSLSIAEISASRLKLKWEEDFDYTRFIGTEFLSADKSAILKVPSALIPDEFNFLLNPLHKDFDKVTIVKSTVFKFDNRLLSYK